MKAVAPATKLDFSNTTDFLFLPEEESAKKNISEEIFAWIALGAIVGTALLGLVKFFFGLSPFSVISATIALFYFAIMTFKLYVIYQTRNYDPIEITEPEIRALVIRQPTKKPPWGRLFCLMPLFDDHCARHRGM